MALAACEMKLHAEPLQGERSSLPEPDMIQIKASAPAHRDTDVMPRHRLTRDVMIVIAVKLIIVVAAALFVFGPGQRPKIDAGSIETRLVGTHAGNHNTVSSKLRNIAP